MLFTHDLNIWTVISMCEHSPSRDSPVDSPACVKGVSVVFFSFLVVITLLMLNPDSGHPLTSARFKSVLGNF